MPTDHSTNEVRLSREGAWGVVTLTRPRALNSLSRGMCSAMNAALAEWAADDGVRAVLLAGEGDRAFCAGGDIRWLHDTAREDPAEAATFFRSEYRLDTRLHRYAKPVVALMDGITMGGGVGVSAPAAFRVATDRTLWAMPECGIGLIPDVGASWHLNRLPEGAGLWLALTGARLEGADLVALGLANAFVPSDRIEALTEALLASDGSDPGSVITRSSASAHASLPDLGEVARLYAPAEDVEALIGRLEADGGVLARDGLKAIRAGSPTSVKLTHRLLADAPDDYAAAISREFRVAARLMEGPEFWEGVRAQVIDKDRQPRWRPDSLAGVTDAMLDRYFEAPIGGDLDLNDL